MIRLPNGDWYLDSFVKKFPASQIKTFVQDAQARAERDCLTKRNYHRLNEDNICNHCGFKLDATL